MWYHFAFMAISLALLGGAVAGVWVYLLGPRLPERNVRHHLTLVALLTSAATLFTFWLYLNMPFRVQQIVDQGISGVDIVKLALIYLDLTIPFFTGGIGISLAIGHPLAIGAQSGDSGLDVGHQRHSLGARLGAERHPGLEPGIPCHSADRRGLLSRRRDACRHPRHVASGTQINADPRWFFFIICENLRVSASKRKKEGLCPIE